MGCGGTSGLLHGYVYDDNAHGIYFLEWCDGDHPHSSAFLTIGLGAFHESGDDHYRKRVQHRVAAGLRLTYGPARPLSTGQWALYSWAEVSAWLARHYPATAAAATSHDREIAAADHLIRARHILPPREDRADLAQLLTA